VRGMGEYFSGTGEYFSGVGGLNPADLLRSSDSILKDCQSQSTDPAANNACWISRDNQASAFREGAFAGVVVALGLGWLFWKNKK
jgi:hypothetical protein